ncbi:2-acyl-glycerophospho-ethanolamine acyltransferase [Marinobacter litoralis]|uniref:2-acyl-glycerophospho-ethanolamine acyltransferase n=2 Tax=Marinobacter litoralis TaxID=187981 RepID=A0A3M2R8I9_9GAMM|nr:2-acyl-glycerophospho-ethanolamine acyltransferase [Marinobacter litoralis]
MIAIESITGGLRLSMRLGFFVGFMLFSMMSLVFIRAFELCRGRPINQSILVHRYCLCLCRLLGLRIQTHGSPIDGTGLLVCNHISWTDIPILAANVPLQFIAKQEVASWPLIGWIARQVGTLFVQRGAGDSAAVRQTLVSALHNGRSVMLFPEGTTTNGESVKRFHPNLLGAALAANRPVQAVTIAYHREGQRDRIVPFINDDEFVSHLFRLLSKPPLRVDIMFHPPVNVIQGYSSTKLASVLRQQVIQGLVTLREKQDVRRGVERGGVLEAPASTRQRSCGG